MKKITKIKVDTILKNEESEFFDFICKLGNDNNKTTREIIDFIFNIGLAFTHGYFLGNIIAENMNTTTSFLTNFLNIKIPAFEMLKASSKKENVIFDKIFYDGEPAEFKFSKDKQIIQFRNKNNNKKNSWHSLYLLNKNKPLQWEGDVL